MGGFDFAVAEYFGKNLLSINQTTVFSPEAAQIFYMQFDRNLIWVMAQGGWTLKVSGLPFVWLIFQASSESAL